MWTWARAKPWLLSSTPCHWTGNRGLSDLQRGYREFCHEPTSTEIDFATNGVHNQFFLRMGCNFSCISQPSFESPATGANNPLAFFAAMSPALRRCIDSIPLEAAHSRGRMLSLQGSPISLLSPSTLDRLVRHRMHSCQAGAKKGGCTLSTREARERATSVILFFLFFFTDGHLYRETGGLE